MAWIGRFASRPATLEKSWSEKKHPPSRRMWPTRRLEEVVGVTLLNLMTLTCYLLPAILFPMTPDLRSIATVFHIAPATAVITTRIEKQPATATIIGALSHAPQLIRGQQIRSRANHRPEHLVQRICFADPIPGETVGGRDKL